MVGVLANKEPVLQVELVLKLVTIPSPTPQFFCHGSNFKSPVSLSLQCKGTCKILYSHSLVGEILCSY